MKDSILNTAYCVAILVIDITLVVENIVVAPNVLRKIPAIDAINVNTTG